MHATHSTHMTSYNSSDIFFQTENQPIQIVSKIGLCLSILCLLVTIVLLFTLKYVAIFMGMQSRSYW